MKKYLTEKTVAVGLAALLACGVALGASLSSDDKAANVSPIRAKVVPSMAVCPCEACDCDDCACAGSLCDCVDCPDKVAKTACSCGCETTSQNK